MEVLSWNIQNGRGVDGQIDLDRIARVIQAMGDPDVICLQEVARHMPSMDAGAGLDQVQALAAKFLDHTSFFGAALDRQADAGPRQRFGNLILSRLPVLQCFRHLLPLPPAPGVRQMPRQSTEVVLEKDGRVVRVATTHLAYHSAVQRHAQAQYLRALHEEICANAASSPLAIPQGCYAHVPRPGTAILCGDFNFLATDPEYATLTDNGDDPTWRLLDAWTLVHGERPHAPTCGIFDREQWPEGSHCRDFFFVTEDLAAGVETVEVNIDTDASDHQPLKLLVKLNGRL